MAAQTQAVYLFPTSNLPLSPKSPTSDDLANAMSVDGPQSQQAQPQQQSGGVQPNDAIAGALSTDPTAPDSANESTNDPLPRAAPDENEPHPAGFPSRTEYNEEFENAVMRAVIAHNPPPPPRALRSNSNQIGARSNFGNSVSGNSNNSAGQGNARNSNGARSAEDTAMTDAPPAIPPSALPVPLNDPARIHPSHPSLPSSMLLTEPNGSLLGGPAPWSDDALRACAERMAKENVVQSQEQMKALVEREIVRHVADLRARMAAREAAIKNNKRINEQIRQLEAEREVELRVAERVRAGRKATGDVEV